MRSNFQTNSNCVLFRAGQQGFSHCHSDALSLDLSGNGDPLLVDPGITNYRPTPLTGWYRSADAHNNILVDGLGLRQEGTSFQERTRPVGSDFCFTSHDNWEAATGIFRRDSQDNAKNMTVSRTILFAKPDYWILTDIITGYDQHEITVCWQFAPGRVEVELDHGESYNGKFPRQRASIDSSDRFSVVNRHLGRLRFSLPWMGLQRRDGPICSKHQVQLKIKPSYGNGLVNLPILRKKSILH